MKFVISLLILLFAAIVFGADKHTIKIAIIDTGLDIVDPRFSGHICPEGHKDFTGNGLKDTNSHGTHITGLIQQYAGQGDYCFLIYKYYSDANPGSVNLKNEISAIKEAVTNEANVVNISGGGPEFSEDEYLAIKNNPNTLFVVAAGNEHSNLDLRENFYYPGSYGLPNEIVVGNVDINGERVSSSNYGAHIYAKEIGDNVLSYIPCKKLKNDKMMCDDYMTGTSQATAIHTGKIVRGMLDAAK